MTSVISSVSTKGGSGKSTTIRILSAQLAFEGKKVVILDTDPQRSCVKWLENARQRGEQVDNLVGRNVEQLSALEPLVQTLRDKVDYVFVDLQGAATSMMLPVAKVSDLVILPWAVTHDDWVGVQNSFVLLDMLRKKNPAITAQLVLSNNRITATDLNHPYVTKRFEIAKVMGIRAVRTLIWKRAAYANMLLKTGLIPQSSDKSEAMLKAKQEHEAYTDEMVGILAGRVEADV